MLNVFLNVKYDHEIGPGVYDIHSPRIPTVEEFEKQIELRLDLFSPSQLWVNPDCGLKTRGWDEVKKAIVNMVVATNNIRKKINSV